MIFPVDGEPSRVRRHDGGNDMSLQDASSHQRTSLVEHGACFGLAVAALAGTAVALQWLFQFVPLGL
jgi:hypothetical protein